MALRHLDRRAYGTDELRAVLVRKGADAAVVGEVLERLTGVGLLDDQAYAASLVEQRHDMRHQARRAVVHELKRRGLPSDVVQQATADLDVEADWQGARQIVERRLPRLAGLDDATVWRRLAGALARRGYAPSIVSAVVTEALRERRDE